MKIAVCITTYNEERNVQDLLNSLLKQTKKPDEIIIIDAGSKDKTLEIVRKYQAKNKIIKVKVIKGVSRSVGRNNGITLSDSEIIVLTDAGCIPERNWLKNITHKLKNKDVGLVAGFYTMPFLNSFQKAARVYLGILPSKFDTASFLPSARSAAFKKKIWRKVGGFNPKLNGGAEDSEFFYRCVKANVKIERVKDARVEWGELKKLNYSNLARKLYTYSKGDGLAGIWWHPLKQLSSHNIKMILVYARYIFLLTIFFLSKMGILPYFVPLFILMVYSFWPVYKWQKEIKDIKTRSWLPVLQITSDLVSMYGFLAGTIEGKRI